MMMEALSSSETSVLTRATRHNIQEDDIRECEQLFKSLWNHFEDRNTIIRVAISNIGDERIDLFTENEVATVTDELQGCIHCGPPFIHCSFFFVFLISRIRHWPVPPHNQFPTVGLFTTRRSAWVGSRCMVMQYRTSQEKANVHVFTGLKLTFSMNASSTEWPLWPPRISYYG
jgi:hypothetical protein